MALSGILLNAQLIAPSPIAATPSVTLSYTIEVQDSALGSLGMKSYQIADPTVVASVMAYVQQMLPSMEAQTGIPITIIPVPPPVPPEDVP